MSRQTRKQRLAPKRAAPSREKATSPSRGADSIEALLAEWRRERPELDPSPFGIFGRIWRLSAAMLSDAETWLAPVGLSFESFSLIVTLRRSGPPYELNPTAFYRESLLSSGAITNRIDRVEAEGLVKRLPDPNDRRGTIVRLTPKGRALADRAIKLHFAALTEALSDIDRSERAQLAKLLSKLLMSVEERHIRQRQNGRKRR
jgi:DNA-binding MarR family transcriptional regulator